MTIDEYRRGIPTHQDRGKTIGMLCETKEQCITDDDGVSLPDKLEGLKKLFAKGTQRFTPSPFAIVNTSALFESASIYGI